MKKLIIPGLLFASISIFAQQKPTQPMQVVEEGSSPSQIEMLSPQQKQEMSADMEKRSRKNPRRLDRGQMRQSETPERPEHFKREESPR